MSLRAFSALCPCVSQSQALRALSALLVRLPIDWSSTSRGIKVQREFDVRCFSPSRLFLVGTPSGNASTGVAAWKAKWLPFPHHTDLYSLSMYQCILQHYHGATARVPPTPPDRQGAEGGESASLTIRHGSTFQRDVHVEMWKRYLL